MSIPVIIPDGRSGSTYIKTGRTGNYSLRFNFSVPFLPGIFTKTTSPPENSVLISYPLYINRDDLGVFHGINFESILGRGFPMTIEQIRGYQLKGSYGPAGYYDYYDVYHPGGDFFLTSDSFNSDGSSNFFNYTVTGSVAVSLGPWEEWKIINEFQGGGNHNPARVEYKQIIRPDARWATSVHVVNPNVMTAEHAAANTVSQSGTGRDLMDRYDTFRDSSTFKKSVMDIEIQIPRFMGAQTVSITGFSFEDGHGFGAGYAQSDTSASLTISDNSLTLSRFGIEGSADCYCYLWPHTEVTADILVTKEFDANFGSAAKIDFLVGTGTDFPVSSLTAPNGVLSGPINCTYRLIYFNTYAALYPGAWPDKAVIAMRLNNTWAQANSIPGFGSPEDDANLWIYDDTCWAVTTLTHAASTTMDDFSSVVGWAGAGVTINALAGGGGGMSLLASATGRYVQKTYDLDLRNYRIVRTRFACDAGSVGDAFIFSIGGKNYTVRPTAVGATDYDIDMMAPDTVVASTAIIADITDSAWAPQGPLTGCQQVGFIGITLPHATSIATFNFFHAVRRGTTLPGWIWPEQMPGLYYTEAYHSDATPGSDLWRFLRAKLMGAVVDGKPCCDLYYALRDAHTFIGLMGDAYYQALRENGIGTGYISERMSMNNWVTEVNSSRQLGLHATALAEVVSVDGVTGANVHYYNGRLYADYLTLDSPGVRVPWGADLSNTRVNAWPQYSSVGIYPGMQGYTLRSTKRTWGCAYGTVIDAVPAGKKVVVTSALNPPETLTTDANGFFRSGARATKDILQNVAFRSANALRRVLNSGYQWTGFMAGAHPFANPSNAHHPQWGMYLRVWVQAGNIMFNRSDHSVPIGGFDLSNVTVTSSGFDSDPHVAYDRTGIGRLMCVFCRTSGGSSNVYQTISTDDGATWATPVIVIPNGKHPGPPAVSNDGTILVAGYTGTTGGPGTISAAVQAAGDAAPSSVFIFKDPAGANLSVADDTFGISQGKDGASRWILAVIITGDTGISEWYSTDWDARTWTRVS